ncbi:MAG: hypothetical protein AAB316_06010 [Bacteroidota bacterium]
MKNALLTLLFLSGLAATQLNAQACCTPCPPGCCILSCGEKSKSTAVNEKAGKTETAAATCTPAQLEACKKANVSCAKPSKGASAAAVVAPAESKKGVGETKKTPGVQPVAKQVALREE